MPRGECLGRDRIERSLCPGRNDCVRVTHIEQAVREIAEILIGIVRATLCRFYHLAANYLDFARRERRVQRCLSEKIPRLVPVLPYALHRQNRIIHRCLGADVRSSLGGKLGKCVLAVFRRSLSRSGKHHCFDTCVRRREARRSSTQVHPYRYDFVGRDGLENHGDSGHVELRHLRLCACTCCSEHQTEDNANGSFHCAPPSLISCCGVMPSFVRSCGLSSTAVTWDLPIMYLRA